MPMPSNFQKKECEKIKRLCLICGKKVQPVQLRKDKAVCYFCEIKIYGNPDDKKVIWDEDIVDYL